MMDDIYSNGSSIQKLTESVATLHSLSIPSVIGNDGKDSSGSYYVLSIAKDKPLLRVGVSENGKVITAYPWTKHS